MFLKIRTEKVCLTEDSSCNTNNTWNITGLNLLIRFRGRVSKLARNVGFE
jgi:hypothetical protein